MNEHKALALQALQNMRGDDLARARSAFANCTLGQMQEQHGLSGKTRAEIMCEYETHNARVEAAIRWVNSIN